MKVLETEFKQKGFNLKQIKRNKNVALFERSSKTGFQHWEVVIIRSHNGYTIAGNNIPPSEYYPKEEDWGQFGWTFIDLERANKAFDSLVKEVNKKK